MSDEPVRVEPLRDTVMRLTVENNHMRKLLADSILPCIYCHRPAAAMNRCDHGFPGCPRADDMWVTDVRSPV